MLINHDSSFSWSFTWFAWLYFINTDVAAWRRWFQRHYLFVHFKTFFKLLINWKFFFNLIFYFIKYFVHNFFSSINFYQFFEFYSKKLFLFLYLFTTDDCFLLHLNVQNKLFKSILLCQDVSPECARPISVFCVAARKTSFRTN